MPINITVELSLRDVYRANSAIAIGSKKAWQWMLYFVFESAIGSVLFYALFSLLIRQRAAWIVLFWGPLFFLLFTPYLWFGAPYFAARALFRKNPNVGKPVLWKFFPDRIETHGPVSDNVLQWSAFHTIRETKEQFLLYVQGNFANVLPKQCFGHSGDVAGLRQLIRENFRGKLHLRAALGTPDEVL
jgi:hypothetical protein